MVEINTKQGQIKGFQIELENEIGGGKVTVFQNVPFGKLERFQKPKPFGKWNGIWDGTQRTTGQPQHPSSFNLFLSVSHIWPITKAQKELYESDEPIKIDENVLSLSIYTPSPTDGKTRPVMVWIHGGAWQFGSAEMQNCAALAKSGDVIVVALSYRLGVFGFLFGNWGLWDQIEGLKWVKENIESYGGDRDNVTIFGESAGSCSVESLLCSTKASGLFHRAICQSGTLKSYKGLN